MRARFYRRRGLVLAHLSRCARNLTLRGYEGIRARSAAAGVVRVAVHLDQLLAARGMTLVELSARTGITVVNLSVLKNGRARAIRFSTLTAICDALGCTPGDLLTIAPGAVAKR